MARLGGRHSLAVNIGVSILLGVLCFVCYVLIILLFLTPASLKIESLVAVQDVLLKPTTVVSFISAVLVGATTALVTRAVEHSLWLRLAQNVQVRLTVGESYRLAQWSVSPWARLLYLWNGQSWLLRLGGVILFATAIMNPILLSGITPLQKDVSITTNIAATGDTFAGFVDTGNNAYHGGNSQDNLMTVAALAQMTNVSAPTSSLCTNSGCRLNATASSIQAICSHWEYENPDLAGQINPNFNTSTTYCSPKQPELCVSLLRSQPATYANFGSLNPVCEGNCSGDLAVIFGVWVNSFHAVLDDPLPIQAVECELSFGNVSISQEGPGVVSLSRTTFEKSSYGVIDFGASENAWRRIIQENRSPYTFHANGGSGSNANTLYQNPLASYLLNYAFAVSAETVARRIEDNYDFGTLFAFARAPQAASVTITTTPVNIIWDYNWVVLFVLLLPFVTTAGVLFVCRTIGDDETVVGYNPVEISRRGVIELDHMAVSTHDSAGDYTFDSDGSYNVLNVQPKYAESRI